MQPEGVKRKLTTILAADVEGYSRLMSADEEATLQTLKSYREIIDGLIGRHDGRIFGTGGDSVLAEFGSAVEAVRCAITIQEELRIRNAELADQRQMKFRIGVNVGDVMVEGDNLYGDGVNVAARLEGVAEAGGICISGSTFDQVKDKLSIGFEDIGPQEVKNITQPVPAFRVVPGPVSIAATTATPAGAKRWRIPALAAALVVIIAAGGLAWWQPWVTRVETASLERMAFPLPEKPSIAVLPFANLSGDPEQDYLGDGIADNIITALSRLPDMFVIARNSTFTYKGKAVKVREVAEEFGVRYVLEGSVQRVGDRVRVNVQLIDALTGRHLWAERYEREVEDAFALQDDITLNVLIALEVKLTEGAGARTIRGNTNNPEAYQLVRRGISLFRRLAKQDNAEARRMFQQAVELDPEYAMGWYMLGFTQWQLAKRGWGVDPAQEQARAEALVHKALAIDPSSGAPYIVLSNISRFSRQYDEAITYMEKGVALEPNNALTMAILGQTLAIAGRPEEALPLIQKAIRLSPYTPPLILEWEGLAYHALGRYEEAIAAFERARERGPNSPGPLVWLALTYADMDRMEEARTAAQEVLKLNRKFSAKGFVNGSLDFKDRAKSEHFLATLRQLGLTENQPLKLPDKPSIAVLPFDNLSSDPEQEYFSDGMTENIITTLSKIPKMFVIARNSTFTYKGKPVKVQQVAEELGVRYVLEGSVQRSGDKVRVTAQLIDAVSGHHLWAERYDRQVADIFALQDDIAQNVVTALEVKLTEGEQVRVWRRQTDNPEAYENFLRGRAHFAHLDKVNIAEARRFNEKAVALDPNFAAAWLGLAAAHQLDARFGWSNDRTRSISLSADAVQKALAIDDTQPRAYLDLANLAIVKRQYDQAIPHCEKALSLDPTADVMAHCGRIWTYVDRPQEALELITEAMRRNPYFPGVYFFALGNAHRLLGNYDEAVAGLEAYRDAVPNASGPLIVLAATYAEVGRIEKARATAKELLERHPGSSIKRAAKILRFKDPAEMERLLANLRKAGLPE